MTAVLERVFALLSLLALAGSGVLVVALVRGGVPGWVRSQLALPAATAVAGVATAGSLYLSEVAGYTPCLLCWYQRIAMYPLVIILGVAALRRDTEVWRTSVPLAALGAAIAIWHIAIERFPALAGPCDLEAPCSLKWVEELGFLTIPTMALAGFTAIIVLSLAARAGDR